MNHVCKATLMYMVDENGKTTQPPEKCYHCNKLNNYGEICHMDECEVIDEKVSL